MKMKIILLFFTLNILSCYSSEKNSLTEKIFFDFSLNDNQQIVTEKMEDKRKEVRIKEEDYNFVIIEPTNQNLNEQLNLDFSIGLYNDNILSMSFYDRNSDLLEDLKKQLSIEPEITINSDKTCFVWIFDNIKIKCWLNKRSNLVTYSIFNQIIYDEYHAYIDSLMEDDPFF